MRMEWKGGDRKGTKGKAREEKGRGREEKGREGQGREGKGREAVSVLCLYRVKTGAILLNPISAVSYHWS